MRRVAPARRRRSATSSATSSTATASSSTSPSAGATRSPRSLRRRRSSSTPTIRSSPSSPTDATRRVRFGVDDPRLARPALQHAADSKYCVRCGTPYDYAAAYVGHLGDYRCPDCGHARPPLDVAARAIDLHGARRARVRPRHAGRHGARAAAAARALQRLQRARGRRALRSRSGASLDEIVRRARSVHGRVRPLRADRGRRRGS